MSGRLIIFDTVLRDGEQSPGVSMIKDEKIRTARQPERLKVDMIEAGFAASSNGNLEAICTTALSVKDSHICSFARANDRDISRAAEAFKPARQFRIHMFIATLALHMEKKLRTSPGQVYKQTRLAVRLARQFIDDIEFSPEDGNRSNIGFLRRVLEGVIAEDATTINLPDTMGYMVPEGYTTLTHSVRECTLNSDKVIWSVHHHNDFGMAVVSSLVVVKLGGARQIKYTINDLDERAGNASLEEAVMAVKTRRDYFNLDMGINTTQIIPASKLVSQIVGFIVQPNKVVVGVNAFAHASDIHQGGVLKVYDIYEIIRAEDVGWTANKVVLGKLPGHNAFKQCLQEPGIELDSETGLNATLTRFEELSDQKTEVFDESIVTTILNEAQHNEGKHFHFVSLAQCSKTDERPHTRIIFAADGKEVTGEAEGSGPVDATLDATENKVVSGAGQLLYSVSAITMGTQAQDKVMVRLSKSGRVVNGVGIDPDVVTVSAKIHLTAFNKLQDKNNERLNPQT